MYSYQIFLLLNAAVMASLLLPFVAMLAVAVPSDVVRDDDNDNCPLLLSLPLHGKYMKNGGGGGSYRDERDKMDQELATARYADLYMSYLAVQHVNSKNGVFVNELYDLSCDVNIPYVVVSNHVDAAYEFLHASISSSPLLRNITMQKNQNEEKIEESDVNTTIIITDNNATADQSDKNSSLCAIIGPIDSEASLNLKFANLIAGQPGMVQISPLSFNIDPNNNPQLLHSFFRSSVTAEVLAGNLMKYLRWKERSYVAVLYDSSSTFSSLVWEGLQKHLPANNITMVGFPHESESDATLMRALTDILSSRFSTIVWVESQFTDILKVATVASLANLSTPDYMWIIVPHELMTVEAHWSLSMVQGSPLELFSRRVLLYAYNGNRINGAKYENVHTNERTHQLTQDTLRKLSPSIFSAETSLYDLNVTNVITSAAYLYDSIVSIACGICAAKNMHDNSHFNGIRRANFVGITGDVRFNTLMNERGQDSMTMTMRQFFFSKSNQTDYYIDVSVFRDEIWVDTDDSYAYVLPDRPRNVHTKDRTMSAATKFCFVLTGLIIIVTSMHLLLYINRNKHLEDIAIAQPMYLSLHCIGSLIFSIAHFLFVGVRGNYPYGSVMCHTIPMIRVFGTLLISYNCFIKILIVLQEIKHSRQCIFSQIFFGKLISIPIVISVLFSLTLYKAVTLTDVVIKEDEYGFPRDIFRSCMLTNEENLPIYSVCLLTFILSVLAYSMNLIHTISLQLTNEALTLPQREELAGQIDEVNYNDNKQIYLKRRLNESKVIFYFILASVCAFLVFLSWFAAVRVTVSYNDIPNFVIQTYSSSSNLVIIVLPTYLSSRTKNML